MRRSGVGSADNLPELPAFLVSTRYRTVNPFPQSPRSTESPAVIEAEDHSHSVPVEEDTEMGIPSISHNDEIPASSTIPASPKLLQSTTLPRVRPRRRHLDEKMEMFAKIEARRVEAELTTAQALTQLSEHIGNIGSALMCIANAISDVARKMPNP